MDRNGVISPSVISSSKRRSSAPAPPVLKAVGPKSAAAKSGKNDSSQQKPSEGAKSGKSAAAGDDRQGQSKGKGNKGKGKLNSAAVEDDSDHQIVKLAPIVPKTVPIKRQSMPKRSQLASNAKVSITDFESQALSLPKQEVVRFTTSNFGKCIASFPPELSSKLPREVKKLQRCVLLLSMVADAPRFDKWWKTFRSANGASITFFDVRVALILILRRNATKASQKMHRPPPYTSPLFLLLRKKCRKS